MQRYIYSVLFFLVSQFYIQAQQVEIVEELGIKQMLDHRRMLNFKENRTIRAWSILVLATRDKYEVLKGQQLLKNQYKGVSSNWFYQEPFYRLYIGAFYTKIEAEGLRYKVSKKYPAAFIFKNKRVKASDL